MNVPALETYLSGAALYNYRSLFRDYVNRRSLLAYDAGDAARDALKTAQDFEARRDRLKQAFLSALGGLPPMGTPLNARVTGVAAGEGYRVEKVVFESRPQCFVTANLYLPDGLSGRAGAVLFLCGHFEHAKHDPEYHAVCLELARAGLVVLAQDPVGQGERLSYYEPELNETTVPWGVDEHTYAGHQCLAVGVSVARYFVHDAMRGIDYLCSRPEVDPLRIGVTGNSGGGTQTSLVMVCDDRIAAAAPTTFIMSRRAYQATDLPQDLEQVWPGMSALGFDHEDILLAMAPKPVLVNAVAYDFFPIEGTRATVKRARRFWALYGREGDLELSEDLSDHHYTPALAQASARFFARHLLGREPDPALPPFAPLAQADLLCTKTGQVRAEHPGARFVHEDTADRLGELEQIAGGLSDGERMQRARAWLKQRVLDSRDPWEPNPRFVEGCVCNGLLARSCFWWTQKGLMNHGLMLRDARFAGGELPVTVAVWPEGTGALPQHMDWIYVQCASGRAVFVLDTSACGLFTPQGNGQLGAGDPFGPLYKFGCDLLWLDDSIAALRSYEVLRAFDMAARWPGVQPESLRLHAEGTGALYAACAAFLRGGAELEIKEGFSVAGRARARHYDCSDAIAAYVPGMLRYCDVPDLVRWARMPLPAMKGESR